MDQLTFDNIVNEHRIWLSDIPGGKCADFSYANLSRVDSRGTELSGANFSHANLSNAFLLGANLSHADFSGANLTDVHLWYAKLIHADFSGAKLIHADLSYADLSHADLSHADLSHADLSCANLSDANFTDANLLHTNIRDVDLSSALGMPEAPIVEDIDVKILESIVSGGLLDMSRWHGCETTHCRGGWVVFHAGEAGAKLEEQTTPYLAAYLIYRASRPGVQPPDFFATNDEALESLRQDASRFGIHI